jgi:hypothetical protein
MLLSWLVHYGIVRLRSAAAVKRPSATWSRQMRKDLKGKGIWSSLVAVLVETYQRSNARRDSSF